MKVQGARDNARHGKGYDNGGGCRNRRGDDRSGLNVLATAKLPSRNTMNFCTRKGRHE